MPIPEATLSIKDGALGLAPDNGANKHVKIGVASKGTDYALVEVADPATLRDLFGTGPLVEAAALALSQGAKPVICMRVPPTVDAVPGAVTKQGPGTGSVTIAAVPVSAFKVKVTVAGEAGAAARVQYSLDGGASYNGTDIAVPAPATPLRIPGTFTRVLFTNGAPVSFILNDTFDVALDGTVTKTGTGSGTMTQTSSVADALDLVVLLTADGVNIAAATAAFKYSLDGGLTFSTELAVPTGGKYQLSAVGLQVTFVNGGSGTSFKKDDRHSASITAPGYTLTELAAALDALKADTTAWAFFHVVGPAANTAGAASMFATVDTKAFEMEAQFRYAWGLIELPEDTDAAIKTAFAALASTRVAVAAGMAVYNSAVSGRGLKRSSAWAAAARAGAVSPSEDLARVATGSVPGLKSLVRDEFKTPALDQARFITLRSHIGKTGYFLTNGRMFSPGGSDFEFIQHRRVMDIASATVRAAQLDYLNDSVRVDKTTGLILEQDARNIESTIESRLRTAVTQPGYASDVGVSLDRTGNVLSTKKIVAKYRVVPLAYLKTFEGEIAFFNPALQPI